RQRESASPPQGGVTSVEQFGFPFNRASLDLRRRTGHRGYINSDSGILSKMAWGVEELSTAERVGRAVMAGTDMFADTNDVDAVREAYVKGHFTAARLDEAATLLLEELFALGLFENPYSDPEEADRVVANPEASEAALDAHRRSVVLAKNQESTLPLRAEQLRGKKVYLELFQGGLTVRALDALRRRIAEAHPEVEFTTDHRGADVAILILRPFIGSYFEYVGIGDLARSEEHTSELQ